MSPGPGPVGVPSDLCSHFQVQYPCKLEQGRCDPVGVVHEASVVELTQVRTPRVGDSVAGKTQKHVQTEYGTNPPGFWWVPSTDDK